MHIHLLTSNAFKLETARLALQDTGVEMIPLNINVPEIQADTNAEIARSAALEAAQIIGEPVVREDHGFVLGAVTGFPGPYMAYIEKTVSPETLLKLLHNEADRSASFILAMTYATPSGEYKDFVSTVPATILPEIHEGSKDFGWDSLISLGGDPRALSEYPPESRYQFFTANYYSLLDFLKKSDSKRTKSSR